MESVTCIAPVNIAVIKYWGKRDEKLLLPLNDSISVTLDQMFAKTTIAAGSTFKENTLWLNGKEEQFDTPRVLNVLKQFREKAKKSVQNEESLSWPLHVCSENNFPTAAGLASSAAGYACLVYTLASLYKLQDKIELSALARVGSGSACRSVYGGFVQWKMGDLNDGSDSVAIQLAPSNHWPELEILILVVNDGRKKTSSTGGMSRTVATSSLFQHRVDQCVPERLEKITKAIMERDFRTFGEITMRDSNQFHAVCLDTYPPCVYLNDVSHAIIDLVHRYNTACGDIKVAYTFDAGPNACLFLLKNDVPLFLSAINAVFPNDLIGTDDYIKSIKVKPELLPQTITDKINLESFGQNSLKYIIHTKVGDGPKILPKDETLLDINGNPKRK